MGAKQSKYSSSFCHSHKTGVSCNLGYSSQGITAGPLYPGDILAVLHGPVWNFSAESHFILERFCIWDNVTAEKTFACKEAFVTSSLLTPCGDTWWSPCLIDLWCRQQSLQLGQTSILTLSLTDHGCLFDCFRCSVMSWTLGISCQSAGCLPQALYSGQLFKVMLVNPDDPTSIGRICHVQVFSWALDLPCHVLHCRMWDILICSYQTSFKAAHNPRFKTAPPIWLCRMQSCFVASPFQKFKGSQCFCEQMVLALFPCFRFLLITGSFLLKAFILEYDTPSEHVTFRQTTVASLLASVQAPLECLSFDDLSDHFSNQASHMMGYGCRLSCGCKYHLLWLCRIFDR